MVPSLALLQLTRATFDTGLLYRDILRTLAKTKNKLLVANCLFIFGYGLSYVDFCCLKFCCILLVWKNVGTLPTYRKESFLNNLNMFQGIFMTWCRQKLISMLNLSKRTWNRTYRGTALFIKFAFLATLDWYYRMIETKTITSGTHLFMNTYYQYQWP